MAKRRTTLVRVTGIDRSTLADLVPGCWPKACWSANVRRPDARANTVRLSDAGRQVLDTSAGPAAAADERLLSYLPAKKRESFLKSLGRPWPPWPTTPAQAEAKPAREKPVKVKDGKDKATAKGPKPDRKKKRKNQKNQGNGE